MCVLHAHAFLCFYVCYIRMWCLNVSCQHFEKMQVIWERKETACESINLPPCASDSFSTSEASKTPLLNYPGPIIGGELAPGLVGSLEFPSSVPQDPCNGKRWQLIHPARGIIPDFLMYHVVIMHVPDNMQDSDIRWLLSKLRLHTKRQLGSRLLHFTNYETIQVATIETIKYW